VKGLGDQLVSGERTGEEWTVTAGQGAAVTGHSLDGKPVLAPEQADAVAQLAMRVADRFGGQPQDIEWAIDHQGLLWLLQARPMTAVREPVSWSAPATPGSRIHPGLASAARLCQPASRILKYPVRFARRTGNRSSRALRP
jgi:hypothetical protein